MQPTDHVSGRFSCLWRREGRKEERACSRIALLRASRVEEVDMKARIMRLAITLSAIAATALAGGATLKGF